MEDVGSGSGLPESLKAFCVAQGLVGAVQAGPADPAVGTIMARVQGKLRTILRVKDWLLDPYRDTYGPGI